MRGSGEESAPSGAFNLLGLEVGQQTVIAAAIIVALALLAVWKVRTRNDKYDAYKEPTDR